MLETWNTIKALILQLRHKHENVFIGGKIDSKFWTSTQNGNAILCATICEKIKVDQLDRSDSIFKEDVKSKFLSDFSQFTPEAGRQIVKQLGVLILPEWDIANAMIFDSISKEKDVQYNIEEEIL